LPTGSHLIRISHRTDRNHDDLDSLPLPHQIATSYLCESSGCHCHPSRGCEFRAEPLFHTYHPPGSITEIDGGTIYGSIKKPNATTNPGEGTRGSGSSQMGYRRCRESSFCTSASSIRVLNIAGCESLANIVYANDLMWKLPPAENSSVWYYISAKLGPVPGLLKLPRTMRRGLATWMLPTC